MALDEISSGLISLAEIEAFIRALSAADHVRLMAISSRYSVPSLISSEDLLQEAFLSALDGRRRCPVGLGIVRFLAGAMESIRSVKLKSARRKPEATFSSLQSSDDMPEFDALDEKLSIEEVMIENQEVAKIKSHILGLFSDDLIATLIVEGDMEGIEGDELRNLTELDKTAFASKRRYIRRAIQKAFPKGWQP